ncbi:efflux RND transporter periplasmic adaptor subunit [Thermomonas aquatica]|jgi:HlyD family secretion protein|uniref:Efflux RND transporter periplasmic adaptor subunit n=1 Tax=Thermomonas aquatica TaxID=2202149 RepID=A0A5B7ZPU7_9GAMM|nr:efflux RND transporter periplasmic adaptor subunit [Thermomonas aquatica]QDA56779.1 efflux RND transporter periplasmic adaptor subunit [Thermomonas aquatica]
MSQSRRSPSLPLRKIIIAVVVLALLGLGWYAWSKRTAAEAEGAFRTETVQRGDIRVAISSTGTLSAISTVTVGSQVSGQITEVMVDFNDHVKKGEVLATIDASTYRAQIEQGSAQIASAQASLRQAQAGLRNARLDYERKADLGRQQLVSKSEVDLARASLEQAQAQVNSAQAQIRQQTASTQTTRVNLQRTVIRSPVDGVVLTRTIEPGQTVAASLSAPELFTIAEDLAKMKIELAVDESDIGQVKVGQSVSFNADAFPDRQFKGVVDQVRLSATTSNNVVTYPVVVTVDNSDGTLLPGLTVNAEIEVSKRSNVLTIANAALRFKPTEGSPLAAMQPAGPGQAQAQGGGRGNAGMADDLQALAASMKLDSRQQAAFDSGLQEMQKRQAERMAQAQGQNGQQGGSRLFGGGPGGPPRTGRAPDASMQAQMRSRMRERFKQQFAAFTASLDDAQRATWNSALEAQLSAKRVTVYKLVDGKPVAVMARVGASDGTNTEISGREIAEGDLVISGERAATESK